MNKGSQPKMILFHYTTVQKVKVGRIKVWCYQLAYVHDVFINKKCSLCEGSWSELCI